jgi:hypothetical protein
MRRLMLLALPIITGCVLWAPVENGEVYIPDDLHRFWWTNVEACVGINAPIEAADIQIVESLLQRHQRVGLFTGPNQIRLQRGYEDNARVFQHEAFHFLMWFRHRRLDADHSDPRWQRCGLLRGTGTQAPPTPLVCSDSTYILRPCPEGTP